MCYMPMILWCLRIWSLFLRSGTLEEKKKSKTEVKEICIADKKWKWMWLILLQKKYKVVFLKEKKQYICETKSCKCHGQLEVDKDKKCDEIDIQLFNM